MARASETPNELSVHSGMGCSDAAWRQEGAAPESGMADGPLGQAGEKGLRMSAPGNPCCNLGYPYHLITVRLHPSRHSPQSLPGTDALTVGCT